MDDQVASYTRRRQAWNPRAMFEMTSTSKNVHWKSGLSSACELLLSVPVLSFLTRDRVKIALFPLDLWNSSGPSSPDMPGSILNRS
jgi:hypothetical protein